ncbi:MAG: ATP-dependent Clp protease ATP-binding subunit ClpX [Lachnospiraceae bacterium]|nr:ATP-dependent Clp protease ATP-binding subunit ClpX [Lachnospiraceae bacterium]
MATDDIIKDDNNNEYEDICYMCRRPESVAGKMLKMTGNMCVCRDCMQKTFDMMSGGDNPLGDMGFGLFPGMGFPGMQIQDIPKSQRLRKKAKPETAGAAGGEEAAEAPVFDFRKLPPPHKIREKLDEYVIGQDRAKKIISVAVYNHYKRVTKDASGDIEIEKSNMLMIGPTGCGKTYLVQTLARILNVPLAITDATSLTEAGYIGDDVESVLSKLLKAADNDVERAESGIVFIDEIDKIAKKKNTTSRDVSGESVQQGLLKLLEGADVEVPVGASSKNAMVPMTTINTKNILFICGGAFPDLEEIVKQRLSKQSFIGFNADLKDKYDNDPDILDKVTNEDLREFGLIPEFIGRLPIIYSLKGLDEAMLVKIMREPKNAILKQYQKLLALDEVDLEFDEDALAAIAKKALEKKTGARGLRSIIEDFMLDIMYEIPKDDAIGRVYITADYIEGKGGPRIEMRGQARLAAPQTPQISVNE